MNTKLILKTTIWGTFITVLVYVFEVLHAMAMMAH
jgi:hypothetical protein